MRLSFRLGKGLKLMFIRQETYKKRGKAWKFGLVLVLAISWCLFWTRAWQWVDNHWAFIPGISDSAQASLEVADLLDIPSEAKAQIKAPPTETKAGLPIGLVEGNGDEDDDRGKTFVFRAYAARVEQAKVLTDVTTWSDCGYAATYKEFGHFKFGFASAEEMPIYELISSLFWRIG